MNTPNMRPVVPTSTKVEVLFSRTFLSGSLKGICVEKNRVTFPGYRQAYRWIDATRKMNHDNEVYRDTITAIRRLEE
jgi:hypothetical protein